MLRMLRNLPLVLSIGVAALSFPAAASAAITFAAPTVVSLETSTVAMDVADLDGNGTPDLAYVERDGTFELRVRTKGISNATEDVYDLGVVSAPESVTIGDVSGDDVLDIVVIASDGVTSSTYLYRGFGDGTFARTATATRPGDPTNLASIGDVTRDGRADLVYGDSTLSEVVVVPSAAGGFGTPVAFSTVGAPVTPAIADVDGDSNLDVLASDINNPAHVSVIRSSGAGTFDTPVAYPVGNGASRPVPTDWDGDGDVDIFVASHQTDDALMLVNGGTGTFTPSSPVTVGGDPDKSVGADFDGDGDVDVLSARGATPTSPFALFENTKAAVLPTPIDVASTGGTLQVDAADANGDGRADIVQLASTGDSLRVYANSTTYPAPTGVTLALHEVGNTTATFTATVAAGPTPVDLKVQHGATTAYGTTTSTVRLPASTTTRTRTFSITGLAAGTTYHARVVASTDQHTVNGTNVTFRTTGGTPATKTKLVDRNSMATLRAAQKLKVVGGRATVRVFCPATMPRACAVRLVATGVVIPRTGARQIATGGATVPVGQSRVVQLKLSLAARGRVIRSGVLKSTITMTTKNPGPVDIVRMRKLDLVR